MHERSERFVCRCALPRTLAFEELLTLLQVSYAFVYMSLFLFVLLVKTALLKHLFACKTPEYVVIGRAVSAISAGAAETGSARSRRSWNPRPLQEPLLPSEFGTGMDRSSNQMGKTCESLKGCRRTAKNHEPSKATLSEAAAAAPPPPPPARRSSSSSRSRSNQTINASTLLLLSGGADGIKVHMWQFHNCPLPHDGKKSDRGGCVGSCCFNTSKCGCFRTR